MKNFEKLTLSKFDKNSTVELSGVLGGIANNRTRTVNVAQTASKCEDCRPDYERTVTVRHDD